MLRQFIPRPRQLLGTLRGRAARRVADAPASPAQPPRRADWLLGGSIATLAIAFVAGLLGLRSSTAELQDQSLSTARDLAAMRTDTNDRINGIADDLAKTNRTLGDLMAARGGEAGSKGSTARGIDGHPAPGRGSDGKGEANKGDEAKDAHAAAATKPIATASKPEAVRLVPITVPRPPARAREPQSRRAMPPRAAAAHAATRTPAEVLKAKREELLRQLRLRRLAHRGNGPQPL